MIQQYDRYCWLLYPVIPIILGYPIVFVAHSLLWLVVHYG